MKPITTNDILYEHSQIKTPEEAMAFIRKYPTRVLASIHLYIDNKVYKPAPWFYFQDGELFVECGD